MHDGVFPHDRKSGVRPDGVRGCPTLALLPLVHRHPKPEPVHLQTLLLRHQHQHRRPDHLPDLQRRSRQSQTPLQEEHGSQVPVVQGPREYAQTSRQWRPQGEDDAGERADVGGELCRGRRGYDENVRREK